MKLGFVQRAIVSVITIALISAVTGLIPTIRRYSLFGDDPTVSGAPQTVNDYTELQQDNEELKILLDGLAKKLRNLEKKMEIKL